MKLQRFLRKCAILLIAVLLATPTAQAQNGVRIKDITDLEGAQTNHMIGLGLVVGLNGTGSKTTFTQQFAVDMLQRFQVTTSIKGDSAFKSGNISVVMVTTELGPYARVGSRIEVTVSALDDALSLDNGTLIVTPLKGVDGVEYVTAQGAVSVGGFQFTAAGGARVREAAPTLPLPRRKTTPRLDASPPAPSSSAKRAARSCATARSAFCCASRITTPPAPSPR